MEQEIEAQFRRKIRAALDVTVAEDLADEAIPVNVWADRRQRERFTTTVVHKLHKHSSETSVPESTEHRSSEVKADGGQRWVEQAPPPLTSQLVVAKLWNAGGEPHSTGVANQKHGTRAL